MRPSSLRKRDAMLSAGRRLFLRDGYERTTVDAITAEAGVSKPTLYDHFGDKEGLFSAIVHRSVDALLASVDAAAAVELGPDRSLTEGLLGFVRRIAGGAFSSSDYFVVRSLLASEHPVRGLEAEAEEASTRTFSRHFASLAEAGRIVADKPDRAAQHFLALTLLLAESQTLSAKTDEVLVDGVDAFVRAYARH